MGVVIKKYKWVLGLFFTVVISYMLATYTTLFIAGYFPDVVITTRAPKTVVTVFETRRVPQAAIESVIKRNFFDPKESIIPKDQPTATTTTKPVEKHQKIPKTDKAVETTLNIKLISTISVGNGENPYSSAVIQSGRRLETYTIHSKEMFAPNTKIVRILPRRVEFLNEGRLEFVKLEEFGAGQTGVGLRTPLPNNDILKRISRTDETTEGTIEQEGDVFKIPRSEVNKALANISRLYTDIRIVPYFVAGKAEGMKVLSVRHGSLFQKLGLRRGDILKTINGRTLDIQSGFQMFNDLKNETEFTMELDRRGEEKTFKYEII